MGKVIGIVAEDDMATDGDYLVKNYSSVRWPNSNEQTVSNIKERDRKWKSTPVMPATTASLPMSNQSVVQTAERYPLGWLIKMRKLNTIVSEHILKLKSRMR